MNALRVAKELKQLALEPPPGISVWPVADSTSNLEALLQGPKGTVYEAGLFKLSITVPSRYPLEPPTVLFLTPVLHPNIDAKGRICLDTLNMPPKGSWSPAQSIRTVLLTLQLLLAEPNPQDGLDQTLAEEYMYRRELFDARARQWTLQHACGNSSAQASAAEAGTTGSTAMRQAQASGPPPEASTTTVLDGARQQQQQRSATGGTAVSGPCSRDGQQSGAPTAATDVANAGGGPLPEAAVPTHPVNAASQPLAGASRHNATAAAPGGQQAAAVADTDGRGAKRPAAAPAAAPVSRLGLKRAAVSSSSGAGSQPAAR